MARWVTGAALALACLGAQAVEVTDQAGRRVTLPERVERLVAIPIPLASMVMAVDGGASRLVGMNSASRADFEHGLLGRMFPEAARTPADVAGEGFVPNVEALAASGADLVLQWGDRGESIVKPIEAIGLPVITLRYGDSALAADWLRLVGVALGKAERGEGLARWFEARSAAIARRSEPLPLAERPRTAYLYRSRSGLQLSGKGTSMDADIRLAGGINVAGGVPGFAPTDIEQLLVWDPEVILLNNFEPGLTPRELYDDPRLQGLAAVRERRVYLYPHGGFRWDPPSQETPLALDWLFSVLHPSRAEPGLRQRVVEAYRLLYGYQARGSDLDDLLRIAANGGSQHYLELFAGDRLP